MTSDTSPRQALSRRGFLGAGLGATTAALLGGCELPVGVPPLPSPPPCATPPGLAAIEHVVIVIQENRSFDHYFGTYPAVNGFGDPAARSAGVFEQAWTGSAAPASGRLLPFHLDTHRTSTMCLPELERLWGQVHTQWDGGAMDGYGRAQGGDEGADGVCAMGYYTRADLPVRYALADAFTICDAYFSSVMGDSHPNRLMSVSASVDPDGRAGGPVLATELSSSIQGSASWTTMPERLSSAGVSWKSYGPLSAFTRPGGPLARYSLNPLLYFERFSDPTSELYRLAFEPTWPDDFEADVAAGTLPQVSWITTSWGQTEHPPAPVLGGDIVLRQIVETLSADPALWAKTALFVTYDEAGAFFDHVAPPTPPPGTAGEHLSVDPLPATASGIAGPVGLGPRVPMLVISPYSRGGFVDSNTYDHTSLLRFLETRFGVEVPNLSEWRRGVTGDLTGAFDFSAFDPVVPDLPVPDTALASINTPTCEVGTMVASSEPPPVLPGVQAIPDQEPGPRPRRPLRVCS